MLYPAELRARRKCLDTRLPALGNRAHRVPSGVSFTMCYLQNRFVFVQTPFPVPPATIFSEPPVR